MRRPATTAVHVERGRGMPRPYEVPEMSVGGMWGGFETRPYKCSVSLVLVGATHASPCNHRRSCRKRARHASPLRTPGNEGRRYEGRVSNPPLQTFRFSRARRGDACVALQPPPFMSKEGEAMPRPYEVLETARRLYVGAGLKPAPTN